jgi:hypothetical protein
MEKHTFYVKSVEVTFPHFRKYEFFYYKLTDDKSQLCVTYLENSKDTYGVSFENICLNNVFMEGSYEITEDEFNETFKRTINFLTTKI